VSVHGSHPADHSAGVGEDAEHALKEERTKIGIHVRDESLMKSTKEEKNA